MTRDVQLLLIDPQNDFCDLPPAYIAGQVGPALPVPGAHADMQRVAALIKSAGASFSSISVTLDSHHRLDIAHPTFWTDQAGGEVAPFTEITAADVRAGSYRPRDPASAERALVYLDRLEAAGRYRLMIWPGHCEMGPWGHAVHADVQAALDEWSATSGNKVNEVVKGTNPWTEHYSAILAEVPDAQDATTQLNQPLIDLLARADCIYIAGEASSHCVRATTEHLVDNLQLDQIARVVLVTDCMSPVTGFAAQHAQFIASMQARGVRTASAAEVSQELDPTLRRTAA